MPSDDEVRGIAFMIQSIDRSIERKRIRLERAYDQGEARVITESMLAAQRQRKRLLHRARYLQSRPVRIERTLDGSFHSETAAD